MAQISKRAIEKNIEESISDLFLRGIAELEDQSETAFFFQDLLSSTERINISKRLAVAFMLRKGYEQRVIANILKVSTPTVWRMNQKLKEKGSGVRMFFNKLEKDRRWGEFLGRLEANIDHASVSYSVGKKR